MSKEKYLRQNSPTYVKRDLHMSKEAYTRQKRTANVKRDMHIPKETPTHAHISAVEYEDFVTEDFSTQH